jgi:hypothetical protein
MIIKQLEVILIHQLHQEVMALIKILLISLMIICSKIKQELIIKLIHKDLVKKEKAKI